MKTNRQAEGGFAMIEVLLAVVILAIGLLAGSRMQILGLNYTQAATTRSYATMAANDIIDRMRLNPEAVDTYTGFDSALAVPPDQNCGTNGCNGASGTITDASDDVVDVTITWNDFIKGSTSAQSVTISAVIL